MDNQTETLHLEGKDISSVEDTKQELAEMYVDFLDQQKEGVISMGASLGANLNPLKKDAIAYLVGEETSQEKSDIFSKLKKNLKKKLIERATGGTLLEYNTTSLNKMKALINQYKNDKAKLEALKQQIEEGKDPTKIEDTTDVSGKETAVDENSDDTDENMPDADANAVTHYAREYENVEDIPIGKNITEYLGILTGGVNETVKAKPIIEKQLINHNFMGTELKVNKYMAEALKKVEKDIKASDNEDIKKYDFKDMSTYNRRNVRGSNSLSYHALGLAIDIAPTNNPMVKSTWPKIVTDMPPALIDIFNKHGFVWGGNRGKNDRKEGSSFKSDAMHFEFKDIDYLAVAVKDTNTDNQKQAA